MATLAVTVYIEHNAELHGFRGLYVAQVESFMIAKLIHAHSSAGSQLLEMCRARKLACGSSSVTWMIDITR